MTGEELTSTLTPTEIHAFLTANPPTAPDGYADMAADDAKAIAHVANLAAHTAELANVQDKIDNPFVPE